MVIPSATDIVTADVTLDPIVDSGFKALGDALARIPPGQAFNFTTGAYENQLNNIGILGKFVFASNTGASPNGPFRFDVNTQSLLHVIDRNTNQDAGQTLNMHLAVAAQTNPARRFNTLPWAIAFKHTANQDFVVSAASNLVLNLAVDPGTGAAAVQVDPSDPTRVLKIPTQTNPRGIVISPDDTRAFVLNDVRRPGPATTGLSVRERSLRAADELCPVPSCVPDDVRRGRCLGLLAVSSVVSTLSQRIEK